VFRFSSRLTPALALPLVLACSASTEPAPKSAPHTFVARLGDPFTYLDHDGAAKRALLARINRERVAAGVPSLEYDLRGAKVGDEFCLDSATKGYVGHWDLQGRAPYLRWALSGGVDFHAQNVSSESRRGYGYRESIERLLMDAHQRFMTEQPPDDGHRKTVLDPMFTHVGIGCALVGGEFRMTEEYSSKVADWVQIPDGAVAPGGQAPFAMKVRSGWHVGAVDICYEPPAEPLSASEVGRRGFYAYPRTVRTLRPTLGPNLLYSDNFRGDFHVSVGGRMELAVPLDNGPGDYYVMVYVGRASATTFVPAVAARIEAR